MNWHPDLGTREEIRGFVQDLLATLPNQLGIDEIIAGCQVLTFPAGAPPKYIDVVLGGDAGPPQTGYTQAVLYRGGITGLGVGSYVAVIHLREGNRYEVLMLSGPAGAAVDPAPVDAEYVTMALDGRLTDERVLTAGDWLALTDGGAGGLATLNFEPDLPIRISAGGVLTEYATIQAAITAAVDCETVLVPPGTYAEDITLKNGVCVKGFGPRDKIRITGDEDVVTTAAGGWLENVTIIASNTPAAAMRQAVDFCHAAGTCHLRDVTIMVYSLAQAQLMHAINSTGAGSGLLVLNDIEINIITSQVGSVATGIRVADSYELDLKNFKIVAANTGGVAGDDAYGIVQIASAVVKATEGWLDVTATVAGVATDLFGTITYSEIVNTSNYTIFGQRVGVGTATPGTLLELHAAVGSDPAFRMTDADVAHPFQVLVPVTTAETIAQIGPNSGTAGGLALSGFTDDDIPAFVLQGHIGHAAPSFAAIRLEAFKTDGAAGRTALAATEKVLQVYNGAATPLVTVLGSGNVGIGIIGPSAHLHEDHGAASAAGNGIRSSGTYPNYQLYCTGASLAARNWAIIAPWSAWGDFEIRESNAKDGDPINAGTTRLTILSGGNVGIGTVAPTSKLQVVGLVIYANNAAAVVGGLTAGAFYRTGADPDLVCVVH